MKTKKTVKLMRREKPFLADPEEEFEGKKEARILKRPSFFAERKFAVLEGFGTKFHNQGSAGSGALAVNKGESIIVAPEIKGTSSGKKRKKRVGKSCAEKRNRREFGWKKK